MFNMDDFLDTHEEEEMNVPITVVTCECGKSWVTMHNGKQQYENYEWYNMLAAHFITVHGGPYNGE